MRILGMCGRRELAATVFALSLLIGGLSGQVPAKGVPARQVTGAQGEIPPFKKNGRFVDANAMAETCSYETGVTRGTLLVWGLNFYTATPGECCEACRRFPGCNVWKYCTSEEGCGSIFQHLECWLKYRDPLDKEYRYAYTDTRTPRFVVGFVIRPKANMALDLYYANGEFQRSEVYGTVIRNLWGSSPSGEFRFVAISDCAHLCELYRSRGCDAFHYNGANLNDVDSCTLVSGASRETVFSGNAFITTFFLDTSIHRPRGIVAIDGFWTHIGEAEAYRSIAPGKPIPVLTKDGMQLNYTYITVEECADICSVTKGCDSFDYGAHGNDMCVLRKRAGLKVEANTHGWTTYWSERITERSIDVSPEPEGVKAGLKIPGTLWIVIIVVLAIAFIVAMVTAVLFYKRRTTVVVFRSSAESKLVSPDAPPLEEVDLSLDYENLNLDKDSPVGTGSFGVVYRGTYDRKRVAVKVLSPAFQLGHYLRSFQEEMKILSRVRHRNIVLCYGGSIVPPKICIVEELMDQSLADFLSPNEKKIGLSPKQTMRFVVDMAAGLAHLHPTIIHRDLKPQNILLDKSKRAKLADFGMSRIKAATYLSTDNCTRGTLCYMAPECFQLDTAHICEKVDIYSLGCVIWECLSGEIPWHTMPNHWSILSKVSVNAERPEIPSNVPEPIAQLIRDCWHQSPKLRPSAEQVLERAAELLNTL